MHTVSAVRSWFFRVLLGEVWRGGMGRVVLAVGLGASALGRASEERTSARCSMHHPQFIWQGVHLPPGFRFISTDEGLAGSCRLRMRIKERSTAAPPSSQHPRGPRVGGPHRYPPKDSAQPKSRSNTQSIRHPAPRSLVCLLLLLPLSSL